MNITKFALFVTVCGLICLFFCGCGRVFSNFVNSNVNKPLDEKQISKEYGKAKTVGEIKSDEILESSGITASRCQENVYWTHNDSGDNAFIFAFDKKGEKLGTWKINNAKNYDWEDIAGFKDEKGDCFLYVGEIGNNKLTRSEMIVYRIKEPEVGENDKTSSKKNPLSTDVFETVKFSYPDGNYDAETLLVHPQSGDIYVLTKTMSGPSKVFKVSFPFDLTKTTEARKIAEISVPAIPGGLLTGGEISPDGKRLIICDYFNAYEFLLPQKSQNFDEIWKQEPLIIELGERKQGEAICYSANGKSILATSEKKNSPIIEVERK